MLKPTADGRTSLGNYSNFGTFGNAFKNAHATGGPGHTFSWNGKLFTTDRADGKDCRKVPENQKPVSPNPGNIANSVNPNPKVATDSKPQIDWVTGRPINWSSEEDQQQANFQKAESKKGK